MKVTPSEEYGLRCLLQLAVEYEANRGALTLPEIAAREGLPVPNTAKLLRRLRLAGIVASARGRTGGYTLAKAPGEITIADALRALDRPMFQPSHDCATYTGLNAVCVNTRDCSVRSLWMSLDELIRGALAKVTLADLASNEHRARARFGSVWVDASDLRPAWTKGRESPAATAAVRASTVATPAATAAAPPAAGSLPKTEERENHGS